MFNKEQREAIEKVKSLGGMAEIERCLNDISKLDVFIMGEPIIDTYRFCQPQNLSSKSPSISCEFLYEENYTGGVWAIANHLCDFVSRVTLTAPRGKEAWISELIMEKIDPRIVLFSPKYEMPTPRKIRYITQDTAQRMFEVTELRNTIWDRNNSESLITDMLLRRADLNIIADFGHGLFEENVLLAVAEMHGSLSLNVQTNSSNYGFNPYSKHKRFDYLSIDLREARVAFHDRHSSALDLFKRIHVDKLNVSLTLGKNGSYCHALKQEAFMPAFAESVKDATGAGDAYFGLTSLFVHVGADPCLVAFVGNVFAGLKTKIIGNKSAVSKMELLLALKEVLE